MKFDRIKYTRYFRDTDEWIGVEGDLEEGDTITSSVFSARKTVDDAHRGINEYGVPNNPPSVIGPSIIPAELPVIYKNDETIESKVPGISLDDIMSCNSIVVLDAYKGLIKDNEHLLPAYEKRRAQLVGDGGPR